MVRKFISALPPVLRRRIPLLVFTTILLALFEMFSIGMMVPIISFAFDNESNLTNLFGASFLFVDLKFTGVTLAATFFFVFIFKTAYAIWHSFYQSAFIYDVQAFVSEKIYDLRGLPSCTDSLDGGVENIIHKIVNETSQLTVHFSVPLSIIFSELSVVIALIILMIVFDPLAAMIFFLISISSSLIFFSVIKSSVKSWGEQRLSAEQARSELVLSSIGDSCQLNLLNLKPYFFDIFHFHNQAIRKLLTLQRSFLLIPKTVIEFFSMLSIGAFVFTYFLMGKDMNQIFTSAALFTFIGMRVMPSLNKVAVSFQEFRFAAPLVDSLLKELSYNNHSKFLNVRYAEHIDDNILYRASGGLSIHGVTYNIDFNLSPGDSLLITGPSGCGKSTLIKSLLGFDKGLKEVFINTAVFKREPKISFLKSTGAIFRLSLLENILLGRTLEKDKLQSILNLCRLESLDILGNGGCRIIGNHGFKPSAGEQQRILLARALVGDPDILVLDEALSALDSITYQSIEEDLRNRNRGVLIHVSHHYSKPDDYTHHMTFSK